ncbi:MAG: hypothetical protein KBS95_02070 [Alistipes sp.]|nr:hypothetical protein [Candidatus Alistipes equi]
MEEKLLQWNRTTAAIYKNVLLYSVAGVVASLFGIIPLCGWIADIASVLLIAGFVAFYMRVKDLALLASEQDAAALNKLSNGVCIFLLAKMLVYIPAIGSLFLGPIAMVVAFVLMLLAYNSLKKSETFPNACGMKTLSLALILGVVGAVLAIIPLIGIVGKIIILVAYIMIILGWKKVATPAE